MKYKKSKYKESLKEGESFFDIRYKYNGGRFLITLSARNQSHARQRFIEETNGDWCEIEDISQNK